MRQKLTLDEIGCVCLLLFFGTMGYVPILMPNYGSALTTEGNIQAVHGINHVILFAVWTGILFYLLKSHFRLRLDLLSAKAALAYSAFATFSVVWSSQRSSSFSAGVSLTVSTVFAIYLVTKYPGERLVILFSRLMLLLALGSVVLALAVPRYGIDHFAHNGAWQGVFGQKNGLGLVMSLGTGIVLSLKPSNLREKTFKYGTLFLCVAEVGLSRSREAWIACALILFTHYLFGLYERFAQSSRGVVLLMGALGTVFLGGTVAALWVDILKLFGRDATLTGRTVLWQAVLEQCKNHPWTGYGLGAFWGTGDALPIYAKTAWVPTSAHNGFLECLLELGAVGLVFLLILIFLGVGYAFKIVARKKESTSSKSWIYCFLGILLLNMVGDVTGNINSICWVLVVCGACALEESARAMVPVRSVAEINLQSARDLRFEAEVRTQRILNT
jgi:exopolysaccharide production protein ExoQ